ncbi:DUF4149 domain-containing protein [Campylobacter sp. MG1]|uniref:DUF4149 domain-containing protein n=1 Tax=Campylobacter sp. MG1 TaxID=2976332 RepID=UPI00226C8083|nr:DUF4149 domain-containing protein [Campylobacter sp. MG1]
MKKINDFLLAGIIFVELFIGIVVAPIIFYPSAIIGDGILSHFQSGLLMTQVFVKFNYLLLITCIINFIYELKNKKIIKILLSAFVFILALVFIFYYTQQILNLQSLGDIATKSDNFSNLHNGSELIFKIIVFFQLILFFYKNK